MTTPSELTELMKQGEGPMIDFKKSDFFSHVDGLAKLMVAFANTMGGKILIGVGDKENLEGMRAKKGHEEHIMNIARNNCDPPIYPQFEVVKMDGGDVYVVNIPRFTLFPHAAKIKGRKTFFIRVGSTIREPSLPELAILFAGGTFPAMIGSRKVDEEKKESVRWEIIGPRSLPDPFDLKSKRIKSIPPEIFKSWMLDVPISFPIKFRMENNGNEPLNLTIEIQSTTRAVGFQLAEPIRKWVWKGFPHRETVVISLNNVLRIEVPEKGQTAEFTFDAVYRPNFALSSLLKRAVFNYEFRGRTPSGAKFEGGPYRIEIPITKHKEKSN